MLTGSCLCDRIAFGVTAVPRLLVNCDCSLCRRRSGAAFTSTLLATTDSFEWLRGEAQARHYALPAPRQYAADFCFHCGSPTPSVATAQAAVMVPAGAVDTELPPLPAVHLYVGSKAPWVSITDAWPQFAELPPAEQFTGLFP